MRRKTRALEEVMEVSHGEMRWCADGFSTRKQMKLNDRRGREWRRCREKESKVVRCRTRPCPDLQDSTYTEHKSSNPTTQYLRHPWHHHTEHRARSVWPKYRWVQSSDDRGLMLAHYCLMRRKQAGQKPQYNPHRPKHKSGVHQTSRNQAKLRNLEERRRVARKGALVTVAVALLCWGQQERCHARSCKSSGASSLFSCQAIFFFSLLLYIFCC